MRRTWATLLSRSILQDTNLLDETSTIRTEFQSGLYELDNMQLGFVQNKSGRLFFTKLLRISPMALRKIESEPIHIHAENVIARCWIRESQSDLILIFFKEPVKFKQ